ncbi:hypothetical protein K3495_g4129 [Podosphaera aphanis]|nr:hypothetical protein K3495_g4129 [Podosphaera aphanis]
MSEASDAHDSPTAETSTVEENIAATENTITDDVIQSGAVQEQGSEAVQSEEMPDEDIATNDEAPKDEISEDAGSEDEVSKSEAFKDEEPRDEAPENEVSKDGTSKNEISKDKVSIEEVSEDEISKDEATKDEVISNEEAIKIKTPGETTSMHQDDTYSEKSSSPNITQENHEVPPEDVEMEDVKESTDVREAEDTFEVIDTPTIKLSEPSIPENKSKARRKSSGVPEHRTKKLGKKAAKPRTTHIDAKPGDYFYVRLKGYPLWPAIVCDETMLPTTLLKSRPVTAARPDGTYREEFMDGGPKAKDRSFPVMYLFTNEFGWIPNYDLLEIDFDEVGNTTGTMRKDLVMARQLAAKKHDLDYFKDILKSFMETKEAELLELEKSKEDKRSQKEKKKDAEKKKTPRKPRKSKATVCSDEIADLDMPDADLEVENAETSPLNPGSKRPADEPLEGHPKKKTTIKLTTKTNIGKLNPKSPKNVPKKAKAEKVVKTRKQKTVQPQNAELSIEPVLTAEELRAKKEKDVLFLRHRLQKGLLTKGQELKVEEMQNMSDMFDQLEAHTDLEVSIIRQTKINKVLKAIIKLSYIPMEEEYQFKPRSHNLLEKWNKILADDAEKSSGLTTNPEAKVDKGVFKPSTSKISKVSDIEKSSQSKTSAEENTKNESREASPNETNKTVDDQISPSNEVLEATAQDSEV